MAKVDIETGFASITVLGKESEDEEFLIRHALHQLLKRYGKDYGKTALESTLNELDGYHR